MYVCHQLRTYIQHHCCSTTTYTTIAQQIIIIIIIIVIQATVRRQILILSLFELSALQDEDDPIVLYLSHNLDSSLKIYLAVVNYGL